MVVKLAASMLVCLRATRQSNELLANATMASDVRAMIRAYNMRKLSLRPLSSCALTRPTVRVMRPRSALHSRGRIQSVVMHYHARALPLCPHAIHDYNLATIAPHLLLPRAFESDSLQIPPCGDALAFLLAFGFAITWRGGSPPPWFVPCLAKTWSSVSAAGGSLKRLSKQSLGPPFRKVKYFSKAATVEPLHFLAMGDGVGKLSEYFG